MAVHTCFCVMWQYILSWSLTGGGLKWQELLSQVKTFLFAGHGTAVLYCRMPYCLMY